MDGDLAPRLARGETCRGVWLNLGSVVAAEIAGRAGFDWALIDCEHAPLDAAAVRAQLIALTGTGCVGIVRVPAAQPWMIQQALDAGAGGIMVPRVESAAQARAIVAACRYAPEGTRGVAGAITRAGGYGLGDAAIPPPLIVPQIESRAGAAAVDEIAGVGGVGVLFVGPADYAADLGLAFGSAEHGRAVADLIGRIAAAGAVPGTLAFGTQAADAAAGQGARLIGVGSDIALLAEGFRALAHRGRSGA